MGRPFITLGDRTDHGGVVISASAVTDTHGLRIARVGDQVSCPRQGHGKVTTIVTGDASMIIDGRPAARHGDKCACGATLLAAQAVSVTSEAQDAIRSSGTDLSNSSQLPHSSHDEQVELDTTGQLAHGLPYFIRQGSRTWSGRVGTDGRLPRVGTAGEDQYEVFVGDEALALAEERP